MLNPFEEFLLEIFTIHIGYKIVNFILVALTCFLLFLIQAFHIIQRSIFSIEIIIYLIVLIV